MCCQLTDWPPKVDGASKSITEGNLSREEHYDVVDGLHLLQGEVELAGTCLLDISVHLCVCVCALVQGRVYYSLTSHILHGEKKTSDILHRRGMDSWAQDGLMPCYTFCHRDNS